MAEFNWKDDSDAVVLPFQPKTAVYTGRDGHVVVRQEADAYEEEDPQLVFTPQGALATAWAMIEEAHRIGLPQPSLSLMPVDEGGKPVPVDAGLAAMCQRAPRKVVSLNPDQPSLLEAAE